jgi:hypothetical protein
MATRNITVFCPEPLVYEYHSQDTTLWASEEFNCAVPCPTISFTNKEWKAMTNTFLFVMLISALCISFMFSRIVKTRSYIRSMFIAGFLIYTIVLVLFLFGNLNDKIVCSSEGHYVERDPFCIFQAAVTIFSIILTQVWSVILSFDSYLHISSRVHTNYTFKMRKQYLGLGFGLPFLCALIPLVADNLGFDPKANLPMCLYMFSEEKAYFWITLFLPFFVLNFLCLGLTLAGIVKIQRVLVLSRSPGTRISLHATGDTSRIESRNQQPSAPDEEDERATEEDFASSVDEASDAQRSSLPEVNAETPQPVAMRPELGPGDLISPLLSPDYQYYADQSFMIEEVDFDRNSAYNPRYETPVDPNCLTNVTDSGPNTIADSKASSAMPFQTHKQVSNASLRVDSSQSSSLKWSQIWSSRRGLSGSAESPSLSASTSRIRSWEYIIRKTLKYNGRLILFLTTFCLTTFFVIPILVEMNYVNYNDYNDSAESFVECLLTASVLCPVQTQNGVDNCAKDACGTHPTNRQDLGQVRIECFLFNLKRQLC